MTTRLATTLAAPFLLLAIASPTPAADKKAKKTDLEGTWVAAKKKGPVKTMTFTGNKFEAVIYGKVVKGTFKLNAKEEPAEIDLKITESANEKYKGKTALGIWEFVDGDLRWCSSQPGRKRRPQQFVAVMGDARMLLARLKKSEKK